MTFLPLKADPVISEFCASNQNGLEDEDGDRPDWVEIYNPDATPVALSNWYLTDNATNKTKWRFPAVTLAAGGRLVVFASDKDRRVPGQPLHTNFSLSAGGEYLGLIKNGATAVSKFDPYPPQFGDISYGTPSNFTQTTLVAENATSQWMVPTSATNPAATWNTTGFVATGWNSAPMGLGYDQNAGGVNYGTQIGSGGNTESAMTAQNNSSCYVRVPFTKAAGGAVSGLTLRVKYDDGFAVWLNGQPLLSGGTQVRRNAPATLAWNSNATTAHNDAQAEVFEDFNVTESANLLVNGNNVLAFHFFNRAPNTTDAFLRAALVANVNLATTPAPGYFGTPTPGAANSGVSGLVIPQMVTFSKASGTYTDNFNLTLSGMVSGQQIRYTTDGSMPGPTSALYSSGFQINNSTVVRARIYDPATGALGFVAAVHFEKLATTLSTYNSTNAAFKSSLPVVVLNNRGGGEPPNDNIARSARLQVYDRDATGYSSLATTSAPAFTRNVSVKLRGSSSAGFDKKSYGIEFLDESDAETDAPVLGMPEGSDWALISCYEFDRAFMRNAWIYEISRQAGRWAPRTRLVEVYFNQDGDTLEYADYRGVYILCETIRRGSDRVDIAGIDPADITSPNVTGGYIFKVDRKDSDEFAWRTQRSLPLSGTGGDGLVIYRPKLPELPTQQSSYLVNNFQAFEDTLFNEATVNFTNTRNYRNYIDSASWVDHNIFCALAKNVDALRLSAYFHKDRGGVMVAGPVWDFDRSANSTDPRDNDTTTWVGTGDATNYFTYGWWEKLFADAEFRQLYVDRWQKLRRGPLAAANVQAVFDGYLAEFKTGDAQNPAMRDYARWYGSATSNNITTETNNLKSWLTTRATWIDGLFVPQPAIVLPPSVVTAGQTTTITVPLNTTVYYTTDGSDPRTTGGGLSPTALAYTGSPIPIPSTRLLRARAFRSGTFAVPATNWSGPVEALYLVNEVYATAANLRVSAVNYHPMEPTAAESAALSGIDGGDFEWIELRNVSATPVNLDGVSLPEGSPVAAVALGPFTLAPGARALVVKNPAAFALRYGSAAAARIAGRWTGDGNLSNSGEVISLLDRSGLAIAIFEYGDGSSWPQRADGAGSALEYIGTGWTTDDYENPASWNASRAVHGSPGINPATSPSTIVVNEILANPVSPQLDQIELFNTGSSPVNVGGWYLSNETGALTENDYRQFRIPNGTVIPAGGYVVFSEAQFNPNGAWNSSAGPPAEWEFSLDGYRGGALWLISGDPASGKLSYFEQEEGWTPVSSGMAYGRAPNGSGALVPLATYSPGAVNGAARVGPVQVTEIHYYPSGGTPEFVEISNTGSAAESLENWTLRGDVDFDFAPGFTIAPAESVVVVAFDPSMQPTLATAFRSQYAVPAGVRLVGPWSAADTLGNAEGTVRLRRKVAAPADEPGFVGLMLEDEVNYLAQAPWPTTASGTGSAIRRVGVRKQGSDPTAWKAAAPAPGSGVGGYHAWRLATLGSSPSGESTADPDRDGLANFIEYLMGSNPSAETTLASGIDGSGVKFELNYTLRRDRDDGVLSATQSTGLEEWLPAENDQLISTDGITEQRRAWLPLGEKGFLRLEATEVP